MTDGLLGSGWPAAGGMLGLWSAGLGGSDFSVDAISLSHEGRAEVEERASSKPASPCSGAVPPLGVPSGDGGCRIANGEPDSRRDRKCAYRSGSDMSLLRDDWETGTVDDLVR